MGITSFSKVFGNLLETKNIDELKNKIVIVDAVYIIYKYCIAIRKTGKDYVNEKGHLSSHLYAIFNLATFMLKNYITPIFVFDGKIPDIKKNTINNRKNKKNKAKNELNICDDESDSDNNDYIKNFKKSFYVEDVHYLECQLLLDSLGIKYIVAPEEADAQCATLSHYDDNIIGGIISDDTDILVFGGKKLIKNFNIKNHTYDEYNLEKIFNFLITKANNIRDKFNLKKNDTLIHNNFITLCILMGNDYIDPIRNIKHDKLFEILVLNNFEINPVLNIIKNLKIINVTDIDKFIESYFIKFIEVYNYYLSAKVYENNELFIVRNNINYTVLERLMCKYHDFNKNYINNIINEIPKINFKAKINTDTNVKLKNNNIFTALEYYD